MNASCAQGGWRGRLTGFIWRTIAPYLQRQASFNSRLVDHLNRNVAAARQAHERAEDTTARLREEFARLAEFHARTMVYLQHITAYIDTRDRRVAGSASILNAAISGVSAAGGPRGRGSPAGRRSRAGSRPSRSRRP